MIYCNYINLFKRNFNTESTPLKKGKTMAYKTIIKDLRKILGQWLDLTPPYLETEESTFVTLKTTKIPGFHHIDKQAVTEHFDENEIIKQISDGNIFILKNYCNKGKNLIVEIIKHMPKTGIFLAKIKYGNTWGKPKIFFPITWSPKKVIKKIWEAYENPISKVCLNNNTFILYGLTHENIVIKMTIDLQKKSIEGAHPEAPFNQ